jgi:hypothetical protein
MSTTADTLSRALGGDQDAIRSRERTLRAVSGLVESALHDPAARLVNYIERLETLAEEKAAIASDMAEVLAEAKLEVA